MLHQLDLHGVIENGTIFHCNDGPVREIVQRE